MESVIAEIDREIDRLTKARTMLSTNGTPAKRKYVRAASSNGARKSRVLSPEARRKISEAQKKRWAAGKKTAKKTA